MDILYSSSDSYAFLTGISILSLLENNRECDAIHIYIMDNHISDINKNKLIEVVKEYRRDISFVPMPDMKELTGQEIDTRRWNISTFGRLYMASALPETVHKVLNIDCDTTETDADVLVFTAKRYYESEDKYTYIITSDVDRTKIIDKDVNASIRYMIENNIYRAAAWNKVVKKSIIDSYSMRFKDGYLSEDMDWCGDLLLYAQRFDFYDNPFYAYRQQRNGSITAGKAEKLISDKLYMCEKGYRQALKLEDKEKTELLASYYAYEYSVLLGVSSGVKNKELLSKVKNLQILLNYDISRKVKKVKKLKKYIGYSLTRRALCFFVKIKK